MAVPTVMTAIGLAAVLTLAGQTVPAGAQERPGEGPLDITLEADAAGERLNPGDRVGYTIRVHNTGDTALENAQIVQFVPETMSHVIGSGNAEPEGTRVLWDRPLEPGERATMVSTTEVTGVPEGSSHSSATVCVRPEGGAAVRACASVEHRVHEAVPWPMVAAAALLLFASVVGAVGYARYRSARRPRPEPPTPSNHSPGSVPNVRTFPGAAQVYHLDTHR
ncbi:DUF11 domain-containing protein [Nocardiopsis xinjiangensis]|uniref:DUF11 domain-containing protein n=1 Tax=Nocardiopsis xinjiangensis TaxID=124285 RepID=UPI00034C2BC7|nr:DUF11 domain-containing protein [Nocardiopsis xinjiangensis]